MSKRSSKTSSLRSSANTDEFAAIEYHGIPGGSFECQNAVERLLQFNDRIARARILSFKNSHCLLLSAHSGDLIAIKSGFSSGYSGEGPRRFSYVLQLFELFEIEIEEYAVDEELIARVDYCLLRLTDLDALDHLKPVRPSKWYEYISERDYERGLNGQLPQNFPPIIPLAIVDPRLMDLAINFWKDPDGKLLSGYRRLEDQVRKRTGSKSHGQKVFSDAFGGATPLLGWKNVDEGEKAGRLNLFTGAYLAHRNPRAHRELPASAKKQVSEFLLLNHLFGLESAAVELGNISTAA